MSKKVRVVAVDELFLMEKFVEQIKIMPQIEVTLYYDSPIDDEQIISRAHDAEVILVDVVTDYTRSVLEQLPRLRTILTTSVAVDHIDMDYCAERGIEVVNFPGFNAQAVAEAGITYLLNMIRNIPQAWQNVVNGGWNTFAFQGYELSGKTIGVIGAGNIGSRIIKIAQGFDMQILCHTKRPTQQRANDLGIDSFCELEELLKKSDYVMIAVPSDRTTERLIGEVQLGIMKKQAFLVNIGRSQVVDVEALARAVYSRQIAGVALDMIRREEPYNLFKDSLVVQEFVNSPNVLLLPHLGFNTLESNIRLGERVITELKRVAVIK